METAGVAWAEGRAAAEAIAAHLAGRLPAPGAGHCRHGERAAAATSIRSAWCLPLAGLSPLLLKARAERAARGRLRLMADGREVWSRRHEHRCPSGAFRLPVDRLPREGVGSISVEFEEER